MHRLFQKSALIVLLLLQSICSNAEHIIGGEMYYDCLGGGSFKITLKLYRDCAGPGAQFDNPATISVFNTGNGNWIQDIQIPIPSSGTFFVPPNSVNSCYLLPTSLNLCIEGVIYEQIISLPPLPQGYTLSYQRCCRNPSIVNIQSPQNAGSTYTVQIPGSAFTQCNSSPRFNFFPPVVLCGNQPFSFDHSATDPDGDQLVYSMCTPYDGGTFTNPMPVPAASPPYGFVVFNGPTYSSAQPLASSPPLSLNSSSGFLQGTPAQLGQHVLAVCVQEFRAGVLLSENKRDFQFNVVANCTALPPIQSSINPLTLVPDGTTICNGLTAPFYFFYNNAQPSSSTPYSSFLWDFGVPDVSTDVSTLQNPTFTFPEEGTYTVTLTGNPNSSCPVSCSLEISLYNPIELTIGAFPALEQCITGNSFEFVPNGSYATPATYAWDFGTDASTTTSSLQNPNGISWNTPGTYTVSLDLSDPNCSASATAEITVHPDLSVSFTTNSPSACTNRPVEFTNLSTYSPGATIIWDFGDGNTSTQIQPNHTYSNTGEYDVTLSINNPTGCPGIQSLTQEALVRVNPSPVAALFSDTSVQNMFNPVIGFSDSSTGALNTTFFPGDGNSLNTGNLSYTYNASGNYWAILEVENEFGCFDTDSLNITIEPYFSLFIPNAFSPNGDDINDTFGPIGGGMKTYLFRIFNRWGELVFESDSIEKQWDGTLNGGKKIAQQDVYSYTLSVLSFERKQYVYTGRITLVR